MNVSTKISAAGIPPAKIAQAIDLTLPELSARLEGNAEFTFAELVQVGGFLHVCPSQFLEGVAA